MNSRLETKTFSCVYKQPVDGSEPPAAFGATLAQQMTSWLRENDVMPIAMDCEFTECNRVDNDVEFLHIATVVVIPTEDWEAQQARIMASAMALREVEKPNGQSLAQRT